MGTYLGALNSVGSSTGDSRDEMACRRGQNIVDGGGEEQR